MVFLMQVRGDFLFISYHPSFFFPYKLASLGRYFKKVLRNDAIEASFLNCFFSLPQNLNFFCGCFSKEKKIDILTDSLSNHEPSCIIKLNRLDSRFSKPDQFARKTRKTS